MVVSKCIHCEASAILSRSLLYKVMFTVHLPLRLYGYWNEKNRKHFSSENVLKKQYRFYRQYDVSLMTLVRTQSDVPGSSSEWNIYRYMKSTTISSRIRTRTRSEWTFENKTEPFKSAVRRYLPRSNRRVCNWPCASCPKAAAYRPTACASHKNNYYSYVIRVRTCVCK